MSSTELSSTELSSTELSSTELSGRAPASVRTKRANGIASREAILDAAAAIAGERGYEGTSIKAVSDRSGLPASSIYWHFENKDELIAAVIDRSFASWVELLGRTPEADAGDASDTATTTGRAAFVARYRHSAAQLTRHPDFLRLGLMLLLEQRPDEPTARQRFQAARDESLRQLRVQFGRVFPQLSETDREALTRLTLAGADGLFIAAEAGETDLVGGFALLAETIHRTAEARSAAPNSSSPDSPDSPERD